MSLATQITAAFQAVATAMGKEQDWATSFTSKITAQTGASAASKTVPGVVQLATAAQTLAGTDDTAALTAADLTSIRASQADVFAGTAGLLVPPSALAGGAPGHRRYTSIVAMNADTTAMDGALASIPSFTTTNGSVLASTWRKTGSYWYPFGHLKCTNAATLTDIKNYPTTYTNVFFDPRFTNALVMRDGGTAANGWNEYMWIGATTGFLQWTGPVGSLTFIGSADKTSGQPHKVSVRGDQVDITLHGTVGTSAIAALGNVATLPTGIQPVQRLMPLSGVYSNSGAWPTCNFYVDWGTTPYALRPLSNSLPANADFGVNGTFERVIPTS